MGRMRGLAVDHVAAHSQPDPAVLAATATPPAAGSLSATVAHESGRSPDLDVRPRVKHDTKT
jgi:hypothetical protein